MNTSLNDLNHKSIIKHDATACGTAIISCNSNINNSLTWQQTWGKGPKRLKMLKVEHFSQVLALFPANQDYKGKEKQLNPQLDVTFL